MRRVVSPERRRDLEIIGRACRDFRILHGVTQYEIAKQVRTTMQNISEFERGRNDSATIYNWYLQAGMMPIDTYKARPDYNPFDYKGR